MSVYSCQGFLRLFRNYFEKTAFCLDKKERGGRIFQCRARLILEEWREKEGAIVAFLCWVGFLLWACGLAERQTVVCRGRCFIRREHVLLGVSLVAGFSPG